mmetsp:Transcript_5182/g.8001  ORF Transcript_5182/g.8001 Transcript_5182/m.8001 type:complete len:150 (+) Transcript_5182:1272-1721(+)|eukprot:CAMPEP_0170483672 /NCGR_PEP_ID=MMETSP0208-20121228/3311_1 /TAXON_ID=197538 /ORGANISM="Strombidium inclinatum, Strain S3" /LENGTH=149 /DNA_ID=CAMNT_0010756795 /DNA_START=1196 /DNA_END=1645 /DNA_ORIENTATION=+
MHSVSSDFCGATADPSFTTLQEYPAFLFPEKLKGLNEECIAKRDTSPTPSTLPAALEVALSEYHSQKKRLLEEEDAGESSSVASRDISKTLGLSDQFILARNLADETRLFSLLKNTDDIQLSIDFMVLIDSLEQDPDEILFADTSEIPY